MAIRTDRTIRDASVEVNGNPILVRHGLDDGNAFPVDTVVVEEDGVIRKATEAEEKNYFSANAADIHRDTVKGLASVLPPASPFTDYLKLKFPEDFE